MAQTVDFKKKYKKLYSPAKKPVIVEVPAFNYLKMDGEGNPNNSSHFQETVRLLYVFSYSLRFMVKKSSDLAYTVMPLEGLWWADDMNVFTGRNKDQWNWSLMILQPEFITVEMVEAARDQVLHKKELEQVHQVRFEEYAAGTCVTMLHIGPYDTEGPNIAKMHRYAKDQGYALDGLHQEIYLSDVRKTAPEKLKTVLRQPIRKEK